jgi:microcin C transport system substrate-binding protein
MMQTPARRLEYSVSNDSKAMKQLTRRQACLMLGATACAGTASPMASAIAEPVRHHALSLIGEPKFKAGFQHFDWINPNAPKGGILRQRAIGSFDTLNHFAAKGSPGVGLSRLLHATLMTTSLDEASTDYCLIAEWVSMSGDVSSATFKLRPEARFHDGTPITPDDVIFSLNVLKAANPQYSLYYKNVVKAERTGDHLVTFTFDRPGNRELPQVVGALPIVPKHYWEAKGEDGQPRDIARGSMEIPIGAGPYRIKHMEGGRGITYERVADWWAKDLPVMRGQWNFDEIRFTYYRDRLAAFEEFKAGKTDFWPESSAKGWATGYDFEAVKRGLVKKQYLKTDQLIPMQGFAFNLRRKQFQDPRVRQAFNLAYDHEFANRNMFFGQYERQSSYFENSELKATGRPSGLELEILESVHGGVPPEVFTEEYKNPVNLTPEDFRRHMSAAHKLFAQAGWKPKDGVLTNADGEPLMVEFLLVQPDFERLVQLYRQSLEKLGVKVSIRVVDSAQYRRRIDTFDFDIVVASFAQSLSPGNEQREFWGSEAAGKEGSRNVIGIKNPAIDKLVERIIFAKDRAELVAATRALDRVLLWNHYLIPQFYSPYERLAHWDKLGRPEKLPTHASALIQVLQAWWIDKDAAKRLELARQ